jgi:transcriptional regulator with XRE-family HTH domain
VPTLATKKKPKHVIAWVREQLGLSQAQLAGLIGSRQPTIQSIEIGRLPLSEYFAYALAEQTGIKAKWFLANELGNSPPDPERVRKSFNEAQLGPWKGILKAHFFPRMKLMRIFVLLRAIVYELGYSGCRATGFDDTMQKMTLKLLDCIDDNKVRKQVYQSARNLVREGDDRVLSLWLADVQEMQRVLRKSRVKPPSER